MGVEMTTKCADWINVKEYVELEDYLIYLKDGIYCVNKETGERELLLEVRGGLGDENRLYPEIKKDLCIENLCGVGDILYVFCRKYYLKINVATREIEQEDVFAGDSIGSWPSWQAEKLNAQCNKDYLLYHVSYTMYLVNQTTGRTDKVRDSNRNEIKANSYRLWGDKIYYLSGEKVYEYDIKSKKSVLLYEPQDGCRIYLFELAVQTINYDETTVDFFEDTMYLAYYDEEESVHRIAVISLDGSGDVEELELDTFTDSEEITNKLVKGSCLYYVTANEEAQIVKYDLMEGKEEILEENSPCVTSSTSGSFRKHTSYDVGTIQVVGQWLYYEDNYGENMHRIPIDGGDCVRVKVKE